MGPLASLSPIPQHCVAPSSQCVTPTPTLPSSALKRTEGAITPTDTGDAKRQRRQATPSVAKRPTIARPSQPPDHPPPDGPDTGNLEAHHAEVPLRPQCTKVSELWAGILSISLSLILMASPLHNIEMLAYSELSEQKRTFNRHMVPDALDIGAYHPDIATQLAGSDVVYTGFQCEPYTISGLQLEEKDRRAIQCPQTTAVIKAVLPHLAMFENVSEFYNNDYRHGVFTKARDDLKDTMHSHDPLIFYDS